MGRFLTTSVPHCRNGANKNRMWKNRKIVKLNVNKMGKKSWNIKLTATIIKKTERVYQMLTNLCAPCMKCTREKS